MKNEIIKASEYGLEKKQVNDVVLAFSEKVKERELISEIYGQLIKKDITPEVAAEARELRLRAVKVKSGIADIHKTQKEFSLAFGKYCDAWKRKETEPVQQMIDSLMEIEKFEERQEQKRLEELQNSRVKELLKYLPDAGERDLSSMDEDVWKAYLSTKMKEHKDMVAAELKAEKARVAKEKAEAKERERIRLENIRLKEEAEKRKKAEAERVAKEAKERKVREEKERKQREELESKLKKEREERELAEAKLREKTEAERKEKERAEAELKARKDAEEARVQSELNKDDAAKVRDLIADFYTLKAKYVFKSDKNKKMYAAVCVLIDKVIHYIKEYAA